MCGIFCVLSSCSEYNEQNLTEIYEKCKVNLNRRGPDDQNTVFIDVKTWKMLVGASVLWLQGKEIVKQPVETDKSWFLYNGDVFDSSVLTSAIRHENGDTKPLLNFLESGTNIRDSFSKVQGPYSFILIDKVNHKLYFGRDTYGRRSLLIGNYSNTLVLTSVCSRTLNIPMMELPALGIYSVNLTDNNLTSLTLNPWHSTNQHFTQKLAELRSFLSVPIKLEVDMCRFSQQEIQFHDPSKDDLSVLEAIRGMKANEAFCLLKSGDKWLKHIETLKNLLEDAISRRIKNQPPFCLNCIKDQIPCNHSTIGVLFSGGLDCAILSLLADKFTDQNRPIDLMNVAFEKSGFNTPDRLTAQQTLKELENLRPNRKWNLVKIDVTRQELCAERKGRISDLIYPLDTILDESLGCALWFAARGRTQEYISPCRVLLVGMGADELFGGYTRHRAAYKRGGWTELAKELDNDWKNISHRNLARDDRVISDHGRQLRTPYLDENVVEFIQTLEAWERCYPSEVIPQGLGDKLLLRSLAFHLGLEQAAVLRKRALQFGSRIANSKENAHEKSPRL